MRILWLSGLPAQVQEEGLGCEDHGSQHELSWIVSHLPPPAVVELHVACLWPGGRARKDVIYKGAIFHLLPCPRRGRAALLFLRDKTYYETLYRELQPDIVHGWGTEDSAGLVAAALCPRQHVLSTQGIVNAILPHIDKTIRYVICAYMERVILSRVKNIFAENEFSAGQVARLGFKGSTYIVDHPLKNEYLQASPSDGAGRRVLFVGRISRAKGYADCVHAFADAAPSDWSLHMIGSGDSRDEAILRRLVADRALQGRFYHERHARLSDLIALMQQSSILLLPTYIDCGPTALKEALCMGLWPICYDYSGPGAYIPRAGFGSLARYGDRGSLAHLLGECIANKPWLDASRRERCRDFVRATFTPETIWPKVLRNYRQILGNV